MIINYNTKISALLKQHPDALETIVSISPMFAKLRNPVLRKVMASRTSIATAAKMGGCNVDDFYRKLQPLGFEPERTVADSKEKQDNEIPAWLTNTPANKMVLLDVRPVIAGGTDPLEIILANTRKLSPGCVLKITNSFEPVPLIHLLGKKGFQCYVEIINTGLVHTYFYKQGDTGLQAAKLTNTEGWDETASRFKSNVETIDVRAMEMPMPMHTILNSLATLPKHKALFVYHKRIPVFLLPELESQGFCYRIKEISAGEVHMMIYKN